MAAPTVKELKPLIEAGKRTLRPENNGRQYKKGERAMMIEHEKKSPPTFDVK